MFKIKKGLDPDHILVKALQYGVSLLLTTQCARLPAPTGRAPEALGA